MLPRGVSALAAGAAMSVLAACSSTSTSSGTTRSSDAGTPPGQPRSFRRDVFPILAQACALSTCHGDSQNDLHLASDDPDGVYALLLGETHTAQGARYIVPGDPSMSFLYAKITGDQDAFTASCKVPGCGETMPPGTKIASAQRATIQLWISEGATKD